MKQSVHNTTYSGCASGGLKRRLVELSVSSLVHGEGIIWREAAQLQEETGRYDDTLCRQLSVSDLRGGGGGRNTSLALDTPSNDLPLSLLVQ